MKLVAKPSSLRTKCTVRRRIIIGELGKELNVIPGFIIRKS
jgi:hypothetical protein